MCFFRSFIVSDLGIVSRFEESPGVFFSLMEAILIVE